jgi:hypothetical protein
MAKIYIPAAGKCEILDDINSMAEASTIRFSWKEFTTKSTEANLQELRDCLRPFINISHVVRWDGIRT